MGWYYGPYHKRSDLIKELKDEGKNRICLASCYRGGIRRGVLWSVWENKQYEGCKEDSRWIQCDLLEYSKKMGWGYKPMEECMGPFYYSCPIKYLNMVPVITNADWRKAVIEHHERKRVAKEKR